MKGTYSPADEFWLLIQLHATAFIYGGTSDFELRNGREDKYDFVRP